MESAIEAWPDGDREVFVLRDVQGLDTAETAESLGIASEAPPQTAENIAAPAPLR